MKPLRASDVPVAAPRTGVTNVGEVENTRLVEVVPVAPVAVYPVMLLKQVMEAEAQFVPPPEIPSVPKVFGLPPAERSGWPAVPLLYDDEAPEPVGT
jgi:hypothetical protein